jgi:hypothetical protein
MEFVCFFVQRKKKIDQTLSSNFTYIVYIVPVFESIVHYTTLLYYYNVFWDVLSQLHKTRRVLPVFESIVHYTTLLPVYYYNVCVCAYIKRV